MYVPLRPRRKSCARASNLSMSPRKFELKSDLLCREIVPYAFQVVSFRPCNLNAAKGSAQGTTGKSVDKCNSRFQL